MTSLPLPLAIISTLVSTLIASQKLSLELGIETYEGAAIPTELGNAFTFDFPSDALEEFYECLVQPESSCTRSTCCTLFSVLTPRHYEAKKTYECGDSLDPRIELGVYKCNARLDEYFIASWIWCTRVNKDDSMAARETRSSWLNIKSNNVTLPCVNVRWSETQNILDVRPPFQSQRTAVQIQRGLCTNIATEPTTSSTTAHEEIGDSQNKDNTSFSLIIGVAAAVVVVIIIIIIISVVIWRRKKRQKKPITCYTVSYDYIDTNYELASQRDGNSDKDRGNPAVSSITPLKNINNKRSKMDGNRFNTVTDTYVSAEEIIRNKRAATACVGGGGDVNSDQVTEFISNNDKDHYTIPSLQHVSSNTQYSHCDTPYYDIETSAHDSTSSATNVYSRLGEQVRNFQNPYRDLKYFELNATTESCSADGNPYSQPSLTASTQNVGPTIHTEPARQPFISTAYEYVDI